MEQRWNHPILLKKDNWLRSNRSSTQFSLNAFWLRDPMPSGHNHVITCPPAGLHHLSTPLARSAWLFFNAKLLWLISLRGCLGFLCCTVCCERSEHRSWARQQLWPSRWLPGSLNKSGLNRRVRQNNKAVPPNQSPERFGDQNLPNKSSDWLHVTAAIKQKHFQSSEFRCASPKRNPLMFVPKLGYFHGITVLSTKNRLEHIVRTRSKTAGIHRDEHFGENKLSKRQSPSLKTAEPHVSMKAPGAGKLPKTCKKEQIKTAICP